MITIELSLFKYGIFQEKEDKSFDTQLDFDSWFNDLVDYTNELEKACRECGESLDKWSAAFMYKGEKYRLYLDI